MKEEEKNVNVLLGQSHTINNHVDTAIQKLVSMIQVQRDDRLVSALKDLLDAQLKLYNLDGQIIETVYPDKAYLDVAANHLKDARAHQLDLEALVFPQTNEEKKEDTLDSSMIL